jgi:hypothetical protein
MKRFLVLAAVLLLAACGTPQPVIGPLGGIHTHADFKVYLDGKAIDFAKPQYMVKAKYVHVEDMDGDVIHFHATGVTIGEFFRTLGMKFDNKCFVKDGKNYCTDAQNTLKFYVNGEPNEFYGDYLTSDLDKILISYGPKDEDVSAQLASITDKAKTQSSPEGDQMDLSKIG